MPHRALGHGKSFALRVGAVAHQGQYPLLSDLRKSLQIDGVPKHRRVIHFKIACVHHDPRRRVDGQGGRILDAMVRLYELHSKIPQVDHLAVSDHLALHRAQQAVFL